MAKKIIWTEIAQQDRKDILSYWSQRNKSIAYSIKLNQLFMEATQLLAEHPITGRKTIIDHVRVKIVRDYLLVYKNTPAEIQILTIFDSRQNPDKLDDIIESQS